MSSAAENDNKISEAEAAELIELPVGALRDLVDAAYLPRPDANGLFDAGEIRAALEQIGTRADLVALVGKAVRRVTAASAGADDNVLQLRETDIAADPIVRAIDKAQERLGLPPSPDGLALYELNDIGNARRLIDRFGERMLYTDSRGWMVWDGCCWRPSWSDAYKLAIETAQAINSEAEAMAAEGSTDQAKELRKWARTSGNQSRLTAMLHCAASTLIKDVSAFDADPWSLTLPNGHLELRPAPMLLDHRLDELSTRLAGAEYHPDADAPNWRAFLDEVLPDQGVQTWLQRWLGYCLSGDVGEHKFVIFSGSGANGKSTLVRVLEAVFGSYAVKIGVDTVLHAPSRGGSGPSPDIARLVGRRLVTTEEPDPGARLSESTIKRLAGGDTLVARHLNREFFEFRPSAHFIMSCNELPKVWGHDHGLRRRLVVVPFTQTFDRNGPDPAAPIIRQELPGVLNWLLDGFRLWLEGGLGDLPQACIDAAADWFEAADREREFCELATQAGGAEHWIGRRELYEAYRQWCRDNGYEPRSEKLAGARFRQALGQPTDKKIDGRSRKVFKGWSLLPDYQPKSSFDDH